ncbi:polyphenol oxidase family protein [Nesterenkonia flava]|uniref:Polyphenol oxidase family protein n=1 Tax=Nesterenkonia flava TaxID=469799 RepID=A0ABU1FVP3_9MICC|nr:polyphenol oxidase family protein [Nesterenkonia flava]MDR5712545.1 polyphenol oxidase family protein [Nesterenkonia flava]
MLQTPEHSSPRSPFWWSHTQDGIRLGFTSIGAGSLSLNVGEGGEQNRRDLERHMGLESGALRFLHQVHSADVLDAEAEFPDAVPTGDAWVSAQASQALAIMTADCLPVLFAGRRQDGSPLIGAAHAGRVGLLGGVLENTVAALRERGAEQLTAWIGPAACGRCYEVPQRMVDELAEARPALASMTSWGTPALDLRAEATRVLQEDGAVVVDVFGCTLEDPDLYSHRRSQQEGTPDGRIAGVIWWKP